MQPVAADVVLVAHFPDKTKRVINWKAIEDYCIYIYHCEGKYWRFLFEILFFVLLFTVEDHLVKVRVLQNEGKQECTPQLYSCYTG